MKLSEVTIVESKIHATKLDEFSWNDVKKGAGRAGATLSKLPGAIQRGSKSIERAANAYTKGAKSTGNAVAGAANALGRAGAETFNQTVARPVAGAWNAGKSVAQAATAATQKGYGDVKQAAKTVGSGISTAQSDLGNVAKFAGKTAADAVGGTTRAAGAVAGIPQGVGRATKRGYETGVNTIGGPDDKALAAQKRATSKAQKSFAMPSGYSSMSYSMPGTTKAATPNVVNQAMTAVDALDKKGKKTVHDQLEKELYGNRSDTARRANAIRSKIQTKSPMLQTEGKDYKIWGQK